MAAEETKAAATTTTTEFDPAKWLDQVADTMKVTDDAAARRRGLAALNDFIASAVQPGQVVNKDVETNIKMWIGAIDQKMTAQMNEILHNPALQKLEGTGPVAMTAVWPHIGGFDHISRAQNQIAYSHIANHRYLIVIELRIASLSLKHC